MLQAISLTFSQNIVLKYVIFKICLCLVCSLIKCTTNPPVVGLIVPSKAIIKNFMINKCLKNKTCVNLDTVYYIQAVEQS